MAFMKSETTRLRSCKTALAERLIKRGKGALALAHHRAMCRVARFASGGWRVALKRRWRNNKTPRNGGDSKSGADMAKVKIFADRQPVYTGGGGRAAIFCRILCYQARGRRRRQAGVDRNLAAPHETSHALLPYLAGGLGAARGGSRRRHAIGQADLRRRRSILSGLYLRPRTQRLCRHGEGGMALSDYRSLNGRWTDRWGAAMRTAAIFATIPLPWCAFLQYTAPATCRVTLHAAAAAACRCRLRRVCSATLLRVCRAAPRTACHAPAPLTRLYISYPVVPLYRGS